jgi:Family of unknown function (DUF5330)
MRFLLRLAFWLGVVAVLLPRGEQQPPSPAPVSAGEAVAAAAATVGDVAKFCDRQPDACSVGTQAAEALGDRARDGAKRLYEMFNEKFGEKPQEKPAEKLASVDNDRITAASWAANLKSVPLPPARPAQRVAATPRTSPGVARAASPDTLTPADLAPIWRGPTRKDPA